MLTYACEKMSGGFADITGITARTGKLVNHTRMKPAGDRVFHTKKVADLAVPTTFKLFWFARLTVTPGSVGHGSRDSFRPIICHLGRSNGGQFCRRIIRRSHLLRAISAKF